MFSPDQPLGFFFKQPCAVPFPQGLSLCCVWAVSEAGHGRVVLTFLPAHQVLRLIQHPWSTRTWAGEGEG